MGVTRWEASISSLEKNILYIVHNDRKGIKEIIDQLLFLLSKCLQFLSLFLNYGTTFIGFMHDMKLLRHIHLICLSFGIILMRSRMLLILIYY